MDVHLRLLERRYRETGSLETLNQLNAYRYRSGILLEPFLDIWQEDLAGLLAHYEEGFLVPGPIVRVATARGIIPNFGNRILLTISNYGFEDLSVLPIRMSSIAELFNRRGVQGNIFPPPVGQTHNIELIYRVRENGDVEVEEKISLGSSFDPQNCLRYENTFNKPFPGSVDELLAQMKRDYDVLLQKYWKLISDCFLAEEINAQHLMLAIRNLFKSLPTNPQLDKLLVSKEIKDALHHQAQAYEHNYEFRSLPNLPDHLDEFSLNIEPQGRGKHRKYVVKARIVFSGELEEDEENIDAETVFDFGTPNDAYTEIVNHLEEQDDRNRIDTRKYGDTWAGELEVEEDMGGVLVEMNLERNLSIRYLEHLLNLH